jgi:AcrR family transcriptional regulator
MTEPTGSSQQPPGRRPGLRRGSLTPERIVTESLRLLDEHGVSGFSLPQLGRALGADPTAIYRHFASKDDLVLAIADQLIEQGMAGLEPHACWVDTIIDIIGRQRAVYCAHPAAATLSAHRTTQRPAEIRTINILTGAVLEAGFEGAEAARVCRTLGEFALTASALEAAYLAMDEQQLATDEAAWTSAYLTVDRAEYPHIWQIRTDLPGVTDDQIYETIVSLVIGGLLQRAPRPCRCGRHAPAPSGEALQSADGQVRVQQAAVGHD